MLDGKRRVCSVQARHRSAIASFLRDAVGFFAERFQKPRLQRKRPSTRAAGTVIVKASFRSFAQASLLDVRRNRKCVRRARKRWVKSGRCTCPYCLSATHASEFDGFFGNNPLTNPSFSGRLALLAWLRVLAPFDPHVRGTLALDAGPGLSQWPELGLLPWFEHLELDVYAKERSALLAVLTREGYEATCEREGQRWCVELEELTPTVLWLRTDPSDAGPPTCARLSPEVFRERMREWYPSSRASVFFLDV